MEESGNDNKLPSELEDRGTKRAADVEDDDDGWIGPLPTEASKPKKVKVLEYESVYLNNLPSSDAYEKSYMHKDVVTHLVVTKTEFIITASCDGFVKFWKKSEGEGIEFVKQFRAHLGNVQDIAASCTGELCATISNDKAMKVFDIVNFDMINMLKLGYVPHCCEWIYSPGDAICAIAVAEKDSTNIHIYDGRSDSTALSTVDKLHYKPVTLIRFNPVLELIVTADKSGMVDYSTGPKYDYKFPKNISWQYKTDTDLYEFAKKKCVIHALAFSPCGKKMATICSDRKVRLFKVLTGKLYKVLDESLEHFSELQQSKQLLPNMEFGRRLAAERELEKSEAYTYTQLCFDPSGHFLLYGTMIGVKVINLYTNKCVRTLGKPENARFLQLGLHVGAPRKLNSGIVTVESEASDNPALQNVETDPSLFCTAYKKNRFYIFSRREPFDTKSADSDRDVFNEKPTKEEILSVAQDASYTRVSDAAVIHTTMGDIHVKLFPKECPKTIENFCVHAKNGYYNGHLFHRIIKGFMLQTGDPLGNGTGGESIWGGEFEDEFHPNLRHDRPYTLSMANAGPNTNGSQFFITVTPTAWLDNKHTVFGRVTKGMEIVQKMSNVKTNPRTDKPYDEVSIINVLVR